MKKIICIVCCLFCVVMLCTSCSKTDAISVGEFCNSIQYSEDFFSPKNLERVDALKNLSYDSSKTTGYLVVLSDTENNEWKVYNAKTEKVILDLDKADTEGLYTVDVYGVPFLLVQTEKNSKTNTTVYDASGTVVLKKASALTTDSFGLTGEGLDLFTIDGSIYRLNGETASLVIDNPFFGNLSSIDYATDSYYYDISSDTVTVYNHSLEMVFFWESPYAEGSSYGNISLLSGDKLLFQLNRPLPFTEKKYDYSRSNQKYDLISMIIDVKTGEEKELDLDYAVISVDYFASDIENEYTVNGIENIATIAKIKDKKVLQEVVVSLGSEKAEIVAELFTEAKNCSEIEPFSEDRFLMTCKNGDKYLLDNTGKKIGKFGGSYDYKNNKYLAKGGALYDFNLNLVYNYSDDGKSLVMWMNDTVIFSEYDDETSKIYYYLYTEGSKPNKISGTFNYSSSTSEFFVTKSDSNEYQVYDQYGNEIGDSIKANSLSLVTTYEYGAVIQITNEESKKYYYVLSE